MKLERMFEGKKQNIILSVRCKQLIKKIEKEKFI